MSTSDDNGKTIELSHRRRPAASTGHYLVPIRGAAVQRLVAVTGEALVLGRDPSRPYHLPDPDVSRSHCELRLAGERVLVRDLGSTNGTFIDGVRVSGECALPLSARLEVGRQSLRLERLTPEEVAHHQGLVDELER